MPAIEEVATVTSKGQITLPKAIRQALGVDTGSKVTFSLNENGQVTVSRAVSEHDDPAIAAFLDILADDIQAGRNVASLPDDLAESLQKRASQTAVRLDDEIEGDVAL